MLRRRVVGFGLPVALSVLVLGGCGGGGSGGGDGGGDRTYAIGFQAGLSGASSQFGINEANGAELAVERFNNSPHAPFQLRLVKADDGGVAEKAVPAARRLIDDGGVVAVVGPVFAGPVEASAPLYEEAGLAAVSPSAVPPGVQGARIASYYAETLGLRNVVVVDDATAYGVGLADAVQAELGRSGVRVAAVSVPADARDFGAALSAVRDSGADGLVYAGFYDGAALFAAALRQAGVAVPVISGDGVKDPRFVESAGAAAENWLVACPCADVAANPAAQVFVAEHRAKFRTQPGAYAAEAYDAANLLIEVITRLHAEGAQVTREAVAAALGKASYTGLARVFSPDGAGGSAAAEVYLYQVRSGRIEYLGRIGEPVGG